LPLAEMILQTSSAHVVEALGRIRKLASQGKFSTATEEAYQALQYAPTYLPLHTQIAELLALSGQANEAVTKFLLVAQLYNLRGEAGQAIRLLQRVIPMAPMDLSIRSHLIELLRAQGRVDEALQQYTDLGEVYYMLAELDLARQTYSSGLALVQESPSSQKWAIKILTRMADIDMQRMDMRNALKIVAQLRTLLPEDSTICVQLIDLNFRMQQDLAALSEADSFVATLEKSGQPARALAFLTEVVEAHPDKVDLRRRLAEALGRNGEIVRAVEQWDMIANELLDANNRRGAIAVVERIIALEPPNVDEYRRVLADLRTKG
jgi:tetratricopeptide (TPR) repeat protein